MERAGAPEVFTRVPSAFFDCLNERGCDFTEVFKLSAFELDVSDFVKVDSGLLVSGRFYFVGSASKSVFLNLERFERIHLVLKVFLCDEFDEPFAAAFGIEGPWGAGHALSRVYNSGVAQFKIHGIVNVFNETAVCGLYCGNFGEGIYLVVEPEVAVESVA